LREWLLAAIAASLVAALTVAGLLARSTLRAISNLRARTTELEAEIKLRRETEDTLRQSQKIEAVGQLAGGIAHDFNNLLTIIIGNLDTAQRRIAKIAPAMGASELASLLATPLELAAQGARSAAQLTHRVLAFSRRQALEPVALDLNRLVSGMSDLLRRTLGESIAMETILAAGLWQTFADANQMESALLNVCLNARDAMADGGRLTIETANTYLDEDYAQQFGDVRPGQYVQISVSDTGAGISPEIIQHVFEPFFTTKDSGEGTGLGLAMVHGLVKQSGGHIRIYSEVGVGTAIKIYLPRFATAQEIASAPKATPPENIPLPRARSDETILVVEDNQGVREYAVSSLQELGYRVVEAGNATDAMKIISTTPDIALLFTDVVLPGMNGRELAKTALDARPGLAVLYTTGYTPNAIIHHGRLDPDVHLLSKPYSQQSLGRKVRELLDRIAARPTVA
jgi:signal transduction histidine kinase